ncbi:chromosome partitioning protein ParB [Streptomyces avermitilis]|uniref:Chromosome partitioning protein ParB n=1 Tax=Streptomyces avermitilis TaxID=33903 RepID=A0A4D4LSP5_STRAX|nr:chromosome partitioning protein ParB [Streptomyces avermitilis]GDY75496.1 chromosome partitioning protein ParB [Streptomyces avermitilis]
MSERRRGLGRGLGALIPAAPTGEKAAVPAAASGGGSTSPAAVPVLTAERGVAAAKVATLPPVSHETDELSSNGFGEAPAAPVGAHFAELPLDAITPNSRQPREVFDEDALAELVTSIKEVGLLQPVVVRQVGPARYELIMGERRWRACREAGLDAIPAIVRATDDEKLLLDALLENLHRAQLNPLEEAAAYDQLLKDFNCTHDQLADRIGRSRPQVSNTLRLLKLSPAVQRRVAAGVLSAGHARALLSVEDSEEQDRLAHRIVAEGLSVRAVEEIVTLMGSRPQTAPRSKGPRAGTRLSPALSELATRLSDRFETRVKVDLGQKKGKIVVEFASMDDLQRILSSLAPVRGRFFSRFSRRTTPRRRRAESPGGRTVFPIGRPPERIVSGVYRNTVRSLL